MKSWSKKTNFFDKKSTNCTNQRYVKVEIYKPSRKALRKGGFKYEKKSGERISGGIHDGCNAGGMWRFRKL